MTLSSVNYPCRSACEEEGRSHPASPPEQIEVIWVSLKRYGRGAIARLTPYVPAISLAIALLSIACASIFVVVAEESMGPGAIAFQRLLISGLVFGLWQRWSAVRHASLVGDLVGESDGIQPKQPINLSQIVGLFLLAGSCFAGSLGCAAWSLTQTTVANSTLLNNMMPLFTTLGAWLFLGRQFSGRFVLGLAVAIAGVVVLGLQDLHMAADQLRGDGAAVLAAIFLAITLLCIERLRIQFTAPSIMAGLSLVGAPALLPIALLDGDRLFPADLKTGMAVLALALISQVLGHGLLTYSLKQISSGLVSVLMLTIPVVSALLAAIALGQHLSWVSGLAFLIVLSGIYLAISRQTPAAETTNATETTNQC
ncbi:MAG: DMT family transporter [Elainellaceae cyanobacterium]